MVSGILGEGLIVMDIDGDRVEDDGMPIVPTKL
jgi:hypothetical protein